MILKDKFDIILLVINCILLIIFYDSSNMSEEFKERNFIMLEKNNTMALEISNLVTEAKNNLTKEINKSITYVYWNIGKIIVKHQNEDNNRLEYGKEVLKELSKELTKLLGKGYSYTNLYRL